MTAYMWQRFSLEMIIGILLPVAVNLVFLDMVVFSKLAAAQGVTATENHDPVVAQILPTVMPLIEPTVALTSTQKPKKQMVNIVTLGGGITQSSDWEELPGTEIVLRGSDFPGTTRVYFEAIMHIPTGNGQMSAKLYNVTDKHDVWFSEVSAVGSQASRFEAQISIEPEQKVYRVKVKSSLGYQAVLDTARMRIFRSE